MEHLCSRELLAVISLLGVLFAVNGSVIPRHLQTENDDVSHYIFQSANINPAQANKIVNELKANQLEFQKIESDAVESSEEYYDELSSEELSDESELLIQDNELIFDDVNGRQQTISLRNVIDFVAEDEEESNEFETPVYSLHENNLLGVEPRSISFPNAISLKSIPNYVNLDLFTKENPEDPYELSPIDSKEAPLDMQKPTKVVIHGYLESGSKNWMKIIKDNFLNKSDVNVITVDWFHILALDYLTAARNCKKVGEYLGTTLSILIQTGKIKAEDVHIVGFSLGAQVAGFAGKSILAQTGQKIGQITGLDPARPLFEFPLLVSEKKRLTKNDAVFVDVIHTSGGTLGFKRAVGHVDFWPNKGTGVQPGCGVLKNYVCSHLRAHSLYEESMQSKDFIANECDSWKHYKRGKCDKNKTNFMGFYVLKNLTGDFYLRTYKRSPFARGGVVVE